MYLFIRMHICIKKNYCILIVGENTTHKVAVEALTELKHARSVGQRPRDAESLTT